MNIAEPVFLQCRNSPAELALAAPGTDFNFISYARLARFVNNICRRIISLNFTSGMRVAIFVDDPILHALIVLAFTRLGVVTVSGRTKEASWPFSIDAVVFDKPFPFQAAKTILVDRSWTTGEGEDIESQYIHRGHADEVCRIILTSGTTGHGKAIAVTNRMMAARINRQPLFFGRQAAFCTRTYCDLGLSTALGFQVLLATLSRGGALFLAGEPQDTISSFPIYRVQNMVASPSGLLALLEAAEARPEYQCDFQAIMCTGSVLSQSLSDRARARLCANITKGYGSAEVPSVASMPAHFTTEVQGAVGCILPGIDIGIVDEKDADLPPGKEGIVRIRSEYGVNEYLSDPAETARVFRDGWFYPGDRGYVRPDNILVISGSAKAVLNVGGENLNAEKVEEVIASHPSVQQVAVLAVPNEQGVEQVYALVVPRAGPPLAPQLLENFCRDRLPSKFVPAKFIEVKFLPINKMGRIDRHKLPDVFRNEAAGSGRGRLAQP